MPERQLPGTSMRAPTTGERATDTLQDIYAALAEQPIAQLADLLGLTDLAGVAESFTDPAARTELKQGMARRRVPVSDRRYEELLKQFGGYGRGQSTSRMGGSGERIVPNSQAGVGTPERNMAKIPRFRSEHGTFIKHEGRWWRVKEQPANSLDVTLELLPPGVPEPGTLPRVLQTKTISADDLVGEIRKAKGVKEPVRRREPKFDD